MNKYNIGELVEDYSPEPLAKKLNEMLSNSEKRDVWKQNMQKAKTAGKSSEPKKGGDAKSVKTDAMEDAEVKEDDEEEEEVKKEEKASTPKLKSEIMQGLVDHIKGQKKEDLAKMYGTHV